jgi:hypothetical protein
MKGIKKRRKTSARIVVFLAKIASEHLPKTSRVCGVALPPVRSITENTDLLHALGTVEPDPGAMKPPLSELFEGLLCQSDKDIYFCSLNSGQSMFGI